MKKPPQSVRVINLSYLRRMSPGQLAMGDEYVIYCDRESGKLRIRDRETNAMVADGLTPEQVLEVVKADATKA